MKNRADSVTYIFLFIILIYLATATLSAFTLLPNVDEAWFTIPGYNLANNGFFGTTVLEETTSFRQVRLDGVNQYTYWIMPAFPIIQAVWGKIVGFGLIQTRLVSIIFGTFALISWAYLIKKLSGSSIVSLIAVGIMAVDYHFIYAASLGRMDMMTVSLGISGLAVYLRLREKKLDYAVLSSCALTALAFFSHPLGLLWFISLAILIASLDFKQIRFRHLFFAFLPYIIFGLLWAVYILQRPDLFSLQFGGNASDRWGFFRAPLYELWREIDLRYLFNFGIGEGLSKTGQLKIFILLCYLAAIVGVAAAKPLKNQLFPRIILLIVLQEFLMLLLIDGMKQHYYMIYITPTLTAILAVLLGWLIKKGRLLKIISVSILSVIIVVHLSVNFMRIKRDAYHTKYLSAGSILNQNVKSNDIVMASAEFWFVLNRKENLIDDYRLGYLTNKKAGYIVMDAPRYKDWFNRLGENEPSTHLFIMNLLENNYEIIYEDDVYQVYKSKENE